MIKLRELLNLSPIDMNLHFYTARAMITALRKAGFKANLQTERHVLGLKTHRILTDAPKDVVREIYNVIVSPKNQKELNEIYHPIVKFGDNTFADPLEMDKRNKGATVYPPIDKLSEPDIQDLINKKFPQIEVYRSTFLKMKGEEAIYRVETYNEKTDKMWTASLSVYYEDDDLGGQLAASFI